MRYGPPKALTSSPSDAGTAPEEAKPSHNASMLRTCSSCCEGLMPSRHLGCRRRGRSARRPATQGRLGALRSNAPSKSVCLKGSGARCAGHDHRRLSASAGSPRYAAPAIRCGMRSGAHSKIMISDFASGILAGLAVAMPIGAVGSYLVGLGARQRISVATAAALGVASVDGGYAGCRRYRRSWVAGPRERGV